MPLRHRAILALLVCVRVALSVAVLFDVPGRLRQWEESYNATIGHLLWATGAPSLILPMQYQPWCGGCTVNSLLAAPLLGIGGDHLLLWKLVPLVWTVATHVLGFLALDRHVGRAAAWFWAILFALPVPGLVFVGLMGWGNHAESGALVLAALVLLYGTRPVLLGLLLGVSVWFCRTGIYAVVVLLPLALARRDRIRVLGGLAPGLLLLLLPTSPADLGAGFTGEYLDGGWTRLTRRLAALGTPDTFGRRAFFGFAAPSVLGAPLLLAAGIACGVLVWHRRRLLPALAFAFVVAYSVMNLPVYAVRAESSVNTIRYEAPWLLLVTLILAGGIGTLWSTPSGRRGAVVLLLATLGPIGVSWIGRDWQLDGAVLGMRATDYARTLRLAEARIPTELLASPLRDPRTARVLARVAGHRIGQVWVAEAGRTGTAPPLPEVVDPDRAWGFGEVVAGGFPAEAMPLAVQAGVGIQLGLAGPPLPISLGVDAAEAVTSGFVDARARFARPGEDCPLCTGVGPLVADRCVRAWDVCVAALATADLPTVRGLAIALARPEVDITSLRGVAAHLDRTRAAAWTTGLDDPSAGLDQAGLTAGR